jgi:hypothetical protein
MKLIGLISPNLSECWKTSIKFFRRGYGSKDGR